MEKPNIKSNCDPHQQQIDYSRDLKASTSVTTTSSAAMPCTTLPKWLIRITGGQQPMSTSHPRSLGSSFSDPGLIGVGFTPPKSNHLIIVGSSEGKSKVTIVENGNAQSSSNYDIQNSSSTIFVPKGAFEFTHSASNSPATRRRGSSAIVGSGKTTWSGSGANQLNLAGFDGDSPSTDLDFYYHIRRQQRSQSNIKENTSYEHTRYDQKDAMFTDDMAINNIRKPPLFRKDVELSDVKDLKEKITKVVPTGSRFPIATKESLDGLRKEAMKDGEDDLFAMDEHPTSSHEKEIGHTSEIQNNATGRIEMTDSNKMTLTQQILEKGLPQNWFFQGNESDVGVGSNVIEGRGQNDKKEQPCNNMKGNKLNTSQMREFNIWAPQNL